MPIYNEESTAMDRPLDEVEARILGALIEKEFTTPDNYPLTLNSLTAACNQTSNRDPVMELDEAAVKRSLDELARITRPGGHAVFTVRDVVLERGGFRQAFGRLRAEGRWEPVEESPPFRVFTTS